MYRLALVLAWLAPFAAALTPEEKTFLDRLATAAAERTRHKVVYDGAYRRIPYPGGDVAPDRGVCTDVVIRSYRALGVDLQKEVHEDMKAHYGLYPDVWGQRAPDTNIDHRRVLNLMVFFERHGRGLPLTEKPSDFLPGDVVTWDVGPGRPHIGIVIARRDPVSGRPLVVHNIGHGDVAEDVLFAWRMTGHFRYFGPAKKP